tara:strand:- start:5334 stop:5618 length:285 start_codon:yes stop_codon:yes gene_type:complete
MPKKEEPIEDVMPEDAPEDEEDMLDTIEEDEEGAEEDMEGFVPEYGFDISAALVTEEGDTLCSALIDINDTIGEVARQMSITNKLLLKIASKMK